MRVWACLMLLSTFTTVWANFNDEDPQGFHWYTEKLESHRALTPTPKAPATVQETITTMQPYQQLRYLTNQTRNTLAQALLHPTVKHTAEYMFAQQFWAKKNQQFVRSWQQALVKYPELDYRLNFPTDNNAIPVRNDERQALIERTLQKLPKQYGLILFYRGHSALCQKFISKFIPYFSKYHFSMISVVTDDQPIVGLPNPKSVPMKVVSRVMHLKPRYLPALYLVDLKNQKMQAVSYGFMSMDDLQERFLDVVSNFKRFSYEGLGETKL